MNILIILSAIVGICFAQQGDIKDCEPRQSAVSVRDVQDIYQRPQAYDAVDYSPHSTYGPPDPVKTAPRRTYPQDISEGANSPRPTYIQPPTYSDVRQQFPYAPVYGPPPPRSRVAAAAGIYDDYDDSHYAQAPVVPVLPVVRRYNINYAQREPYQPNYGYDAAYSSRHHEYRVPVYYAPLPGGFYPIRSHAIPAAVTTSTTTTTEEPRTQPLPVTLPIIQTFTHPENVTYDETNVRRHQPAVIEISSEEEVVPRRKFRKPFSGLASLFRGSIISTRDKIGVIPSIVQRSFNKSIG